MGDIEKNEGSFIMVNILSLKQQTMGVAAIFLGLLSEHKTSEIIISIALSTCIPVLLILLYRMFIRRDPKRQTDLYHTRTIQLFVVGISIPTVTILTTMLESC